MNTTTNAWRFQSWTAFVLSFGITAIGILWLPLGIWPKAFLGMGFLFTVAQCFTLAKTIRDDADGGRVRAESERGYREAVMSR
jgi:hypothetical protein